MLHSSSSSGIFFQGDMQNLQLGSFGNMSNPVNMHPNVAHVTPVSSDINNNAMNSASSIVTDANSGLSGGISGLPTSPLSFSSNNLGSCIIDGPSTVNQVRVHDNVSHLQKKPRLDTKQDDNIIQQQAVQQILQRQDTMQLQNPNPQLQALIQQQRLRQQQQQQILQSLPPMQRAHLLQQQQLRQLQQQGVQPGNAVKRPYDGGVCSRRLMQYLYHQRQRPADNSIAYWRKFVAEYYSPRAKQRWCLSLYDNVGHHSLGVFPQAAVDSWQCDICGSKSGKGFEATFEVLPRLNEIKFSSGVIDELLFLDLPHESRFPSGVMMLEYGKAVQESVYEQLRVVRQGQLKVIFTPDLKILTWEFCARRHEELLPRRLIAPQVNQLLQVAQKCQATIAEGGSNGASQQDLQTNSNMVVTAWRQLARSLELQSLNDLGFSKRYVRCLQISEVVSSMKDLMDFCHETKVGPIEGLKSFPRQMSNDRNALNKLAGLHPGHQMGGGNNGLTLTNYQNMLMRQKSMNNSVAQVNTHLLHHQQQPPPSQGGGGSQVAQQQQHMIQQLIQNMNSNNGGGGGGGAGPSRGNSFKGGGASHSDSSAGGGGGGQKAAVVSQEMGSEFPENGFFNDDFEDTMGYGWKE